MLRKLLSCILSKNKFITRTLLKFFLRMHNFSYKYISKLSPLSENNNLHPKHRLLEYHKWFIKRLNPNWVVLDLGCGNGAFSFAIAGHCKKVVAVDINYQNIKIAREKYNRDNIEYICADIRKYYPDKAINAIIMSNVLEHVEDRDKLLTSLKKIANTLLIRAPLLNRDWLTLYKKELGLNYKLDSTHHIEYTLDTFKFEIERAGFKLKEYEVMFGEIYAVIIKN